MVVSKLSGFYAVPGYKLQVYVSVVPFPTAFEYYDLRHFGSTLSFSLALLPTITFDPPIGFLRFNYQNDQQTKAQPWPAFQGSISGSSQPSYTSKT